VLFIVLLGIYLFLIIVTGCLFGGWSDAIYFATGAILVLYTVETHAMRKEMTTQNEESRRMVAEIQVQTELQNRPFLIVECPAAGPCWRGLSAECWKGRGN
jgi:hypothetical protein